MEQRSAFVWNNTTIFRIDGNSTDTIGDNDSCSFPALELWRTTRDSTPLSTVPTESHNTNTKHCTEDDNSLHSYSTCVRHTSSDASSSLLALKQQKKPHLLEQEHPPITTDAGLWSLHALLQPTTRLRDLQQLQMTR